MDSKLDPSAAQGLQSANQGPVLSLEERRRLRDQDPEALDRFFTSYFGRVYGFVRRLVHEEHLAEDLTQDIFVHIHRALPTYDPARDPRPWVFTIATNKVRDFWRSRRHRDSLLETSVEDGGEPAASSYVAPGERLEASELGERVERAVAHLPDSMRETLVLRYYQDLSFEEIGAIVDRNPTAVRKRYSRALEELRKSLAGYLELPDSST